MPSPLRYIPEATELLRGKTLDTPLLLEGELENASSHHLWWIGSPNELANPACDIHFLLEEKGVGANLLENSVFFAIHAVFVSNLLLSQTAEFEECGSLYEFGEEKRNLAILFSGYDSYIGQLVEIVFQAVTDPIQFYFSTVSFSQHPWKPLETLNSFRGSTL